MSNPKGIFLFDVDGTLIRSFMREGHRDQYDAVEVLPGRRSVIRALGFTNVHFGLVTNQAGVAFGYQTEEQVEDKMRRVTEEVFGRRVSASISYGHVRAKIERYRYQPNELVRRKPSGAMILEQLRLRSTVSEPDLDLMMCLKSRTLYVGDMDVDEQAAADAGVDFMWAHEFFDQPSEAPRCSARTENPYTIRISADDRYSETRCIHPARHRGKHNNGLFEWELI